MKPRPVLLWLLATANFVVGMGAFVVIGVLTPVAAAFGIAKADAGALMTLYALVYAISSPILVAATGALDRRRVLLVGMALFCFGTLVAAAAPGFTVLLVARGIMALGGGLLTPVAASIGVTQLPPSERGRALAIVFGGLTFAQVLGVPAGAWLGYSFGWRYAFSAVALLGAASAVVLWRRVPAGLQVPVTTLATLGSVLAAPRLLLAAAFTALFIAGIYTLYTYFAPLLEARLHLGGTGVTLMLVLFGLGAVAGNALGGFLTDRIGSERTLLSLCAAQIVLMPLVSSLEVDVATFGALVAAWSACGWSFMVPQQARLAALDPPRTPVLFALNAAAIYVGGSLGSVIGAQTLKTAGLDRLGFAGAGLAAVAMLSLWVVARINRSR